ncbi:STAS domain-containing protein [bacterium]|jgi:anti-sigma B factor antagonist|nr:STAS domain-containing protein [bacterium]
MEISYSKQKDILIINLNGNLDTVTSHLLQEKIEKIIGEGELKLIIHCAQLNYISSSGLRVFLMTLKRLKPLKGQLILASMKDSIKEIFNISGFSPLFKFSLDIQSGLNSFN